MRICEALRALAVDAAARKGSRHELLSVAQLHLLPNHRHVRELHGGRLHRERGLDLPSSVHLQSRRDATQMQARPALGKPAMPAACVCACACTSCLVLGQRDVPSSGACSLEAVQCCLFENCACVVCPCGSEHRRRCAHAQDRPASGSTRSAPRLVRRPPPRTCIARALN